MKVVNLKNVLFFLLLVFISNFGWSQINITATGDQFYCPQSEISIVTGFNISDDSNSIESIFIQISEGYIQSEDELILNNPTANISENWKSSEGKLTLSWTGSANVDYNELINAVKSVVFKSSSLSPSDKSFSITISDANYLPSTGHFYQYISDLGITWQDAKIAAETLSYYGLQGYLATITIFEEKQLTGEQASGAGWIGGSDAETEGVWKWVTGPEGLNGGTVFWNGLANGSTPNYAFWNTNEPNQSGNEDYAHITAPTVGIRGSWNDLSNTGASSGDYQPKGYIVEYGGMSGDPEINISASTKISIAKIITTIPNSTCGTGSVNLSATSSSGFVLWFDQLTGGIILHEGDTFLISNISTTTTYYALASSDGNCENGIRTPVVATVNDIPTITTQDITICGASSGTLVASASAGIINWYNTATGGISIGTGSTFISPSITTTTTYYIDATENGCTTTTRVPVTINVQYTLAPTSTEPQQQFCDIENAIIDDLLISEDSILWYDSPSGGTQLTNSDVLVSNTYYASQTVNGCESTARLSIDVSIFETIIPPVTIAPLTACDSVNDGDDTNGITQFDLTLNETDILNGKVATNFSFTYFNDASYSTASQILNQTNFLNTTTGGQIIYVRITNNLDATCFTDTSFEIIVNELPIIQSSISFENCDEDGTSDGYTDFNLDEASPIITNGNQTFKVTYHLSFNEAETGINILNPSPFNNIDAIGNMVYARVENEFGCYRISTVNLDVSTTTLPANFNYELTNCDTDDTSDGLFLFDLSDATQHFLEQLPPQNLSVHYFRNLQDAQLEQNEILPQNAYMNETSFFQSLFVRVENDDNGNCFGIGEHLTLTVFPRPEFEVNPTEIVCLNLYSINLEVFNPQGSYTYQWFNENGIVIGTNSTVEVSSGGIYTVVATSSLNCESFPQTVTVSESIIATISSDDVNITDDSENNTITINTNNLGIGDYEFALDNNFGSYQDEPYFEGVAAGIHTIFIRDKNSCGIAELVISVIGFPKFFTPNNDGVNDKWQIKGVCSDFFPTSLIYIFDRFGKLITQINPSGDGWDGTFNGEILSSTDYWFSVQLIDLNGNIREKRGHFSLIRR